MSAVAVLALAGLATYVLRITFVTLVPAAGLPAVVRESLDHVGPAVLAALVAVALVNGGGQGFGAAPAAAALLAGLVAWRTRNLLLTTVSGIATLALLELVLAG